MAMKKNEAFKVAVKVLSKLMASDNGETESIEAFAYIHTAEAEKDYGKIYTALEETRKFIVKLQIALKKKQLCHKVKTSTTRMKCRNKQLRPLN